jgi:hypothetical protein
VQKGGVVQAGGVQKGNGVLQNEDVAQHGSQKKRRTSSPLQLVRGGTKDVGLVGGAGRASLRLASKQS